MPPSYYEIRVTGILPPEALLDFERLKASVEPVETVVHGPLRIRPRCTGSWSGSTPSAYRSWTYAVSMTQLRLTRLRLTG